MEAFLILWIAMDKRVVPHLNKRVPVGDGFAGIREHLAPVVAAEVVCIVANATHADDLVVADTASAGGKDKH